MPYVEIQYILQDCLRIWENVEEGVSNQSALTRFTNVIEHIFVVHFIRDIINRSPNAFVETLSNIAFFIDGALAIYVKSCLGSWCNYEIFV